MAIELCVLASGSRGNCIYVGSERTRILIDAGISGKATTERLGMIGVDPATLQAICLTHEHDDHRSAVGILHRKLGVELYANAGTVDALGHLPKFASLPWNIFTTGEPFQIGDLTLESFRVSHDSYDPVGFVVSCDGIRVGVATDMGLVTDLVRQRLKNCAALVLEANHDEDMLKDSDRPWPLKQRISGRQGHLSNINSGNLLVDVACEQLRTVFLAHLSSDCNTPQLAKNTVEQSLRGSGISHIAVKLTYAHKPSELIRVS